MRPIDADSLKVRLSGCMILMPNGEKCTAKRAIDTQGTIEPEVRHGRWIPTEYDSYADGAPVWDKWECSECGHDHSGEEDTLTAFCPECGAKMCATDTNVGGKGGAEE